MDITTWIGLGLILGGMLLIFLEIMNPGLFIAVVGTVMVIMGVLILIIGGAIFTAWGALLTVVIAIVASVGTIWGYRKWAPPGEKPITLSKDSLPGLEGRVEQAIPAGGVGEVRVSGQRWHARAEVDLSVGTPIIVDSVDGLTLNVRSK